MLDTRMCDESDLATILAALRLFQRTYEGQNAETIADAWPHFVRADETVIPPLSTEDIDELCERVNVTSTIPEDEAYKAAAKRLWHRDGELEIDDNAIVSKGDEDGAYVEAWIWVRSDEAGIEVPDA